MVSSFFPGEPHPSRTHASVASHRETSHRGSRPLTQGHKGLNPGEGIQSDLPPKRIFQSIPQH